MKTERLGDGLGNGQLLEQRMVVKHHYNGSLLGTVLDKERGTDFIVTCPDGNIFRLDVSLQDKPKKGEGLEMKAKIGEVYVGLRSHNGVANFDIPVFVVRVVLKDAYRKALANHQLDSVQRDGIMDAAADMCHSVVCALMSAKARSRFLPAKLLERFNQNVTDQTSRQNEAKFWGERPKERFYSKFENMV